MTNEEKLTLWLGAFRYYLGRRTYAVSDFCSLLRAEWKNLPKATQVLIRRELKDEVAKDDENRLEMERSGNRNGYKPLGDDCDRKEWLKVLEVIDAKA